MKRFSTVLILLLLVPGTQWGQEGARHHSLAHSPNHPGMVRVPGGQYRPWLLTNGPRRPVDIRPFYLDVHAVTNEDFLEFVKAHPEWQRSRVPGIFADSHYLQQWSGDLVIGDARILKSPVTNISWFAANAYCKWKGKRLPTLGEWEYAAGAPPVNVTGKARLSRIILGWYDHPMPTVLPPAGSTYKNKFGVYDMHGLIWEWVEDFNSILLQGPGGNGSAGPNIFLCGAGSAGTANREDYAAYMRYAFRGSLQASYTVKSLGFRCAQDVETNN